MTYQHDISTAKHRVYTGNKEEAQRFAIMFYGTAIQYMSDIYRVII